MKFIAPLLLIATVAFAQSATDQLNRQMKNSNDSQQLAQLAIALREEGRLCLVREEAEASEPRIICSLGLSTGPPRLGYGSDGSV